MAQTSRYFSPIDFKTRFPALDGIRALAIAMVFFHHLGGGSHGGVILRTINYVRLAGWAGVDLFLVLSGFLITGILFDTQRDSHFFKRFFARRSVRIFPVFYLVCFVLLLLTPIFQYQWRPEHLTFLVYLGNFWGNHDFSLYDIVSSKYSAARVTIGHFWSLCVEEQFYMLWPFLVWKIRDRIRLMQTAIALCALAIILRVILCMELPIGPAQGWVSRTLPFRMDSLLIGGILALLLRGPNSDRWQRSCRWIFLVGLVFTLPIIANPLGAFSLWTLIPGFTIIAITSAGLIGSTLRSGSPAFRLFYFKPFRILGKYSYGFYIYHMLFEHAWGALLVWVIGKTHSLVIGGIVEIGTASIVIFLVSKISYDYFEVRFLHLKKYFEYDSELQEHKHAFLSK